jgi:hypothetical protein
MSTRVGKIRLKTGPNGKVLIEATKPRMAAGQRKNAEGKAKRLADKWKAKSK